MAWVCECGVRYTAAAPCCPQCRSTIHEEEEMPNSTTGGPSYEPGREPADWAGPGIPPEPVPEPPPARAPKADHVEYAGAVLDVPTAEAEQMTKAELVELAQAGPTGDSTPEPSSPESSGPAEPDAAPAPAPKPRPRPASPPAAKDE